MPSNTFSSTQGLPDPGEVFATMTVPEYGYPVLGYASGMGFGYVYGGPLGKVRIGRMLGGLGLFAGALIAYQNAAGRRMGEKR